MDLDREAELEVRGQVVVRYGGREVCRDGGETGRRMRVGPHSGSAAWRGGAGGVVKEGGVAGGSGRVSGGDRASCGRGPGGRRGGRCREANSGRAGGRRRPSDCRVAEGALGELRASCPQMLRVRLVLAV